MNEYDKSDDRLDDLIKFSKETGVSMGLIEGITRGLDDANHDLVMQNFRENILENFVLFRERKP